jgi:hypothetical protein
MHHTLAFEGAVGQTADTDIAAVFDGIIPVDASNHFLPQTSLSLIYAFASALHLSRGKFSSPVFRQIANPAIRPINVALLPVDLIPIADYLANPVQLPPQAPLQYLATSTLACGTEVTYCVLGVLQQYLQPAVGNIITLRATGTTTAVAKSWTYCALTFDQTIIQGTYQVIGAEVISTTGVAFRLTIDNQYYRPGGIAGATDAIRTPPQQRKGGWGVWGQFQNTSPPRLEVLCNAADTAQEIYMDVIKIA